MIYLRIPWSYIESEEGKFNWPVLDTPANVGFPRANRSLSGSPQASPGPAGPHPNGSIARGQGYNLRREGGTRRLGRWEPDFDDPVFLDKLGHFLAAMTVRYDGSPEVAFVDVGSLGVWGEGHTWGSTHRPITAATVKRHIDLYKRHFRKTLLVANDDMGGPETTGPSEAIEYAAAAGLTLRDDSILVQGGNRAFFHAAWAQWFWPKAPVSWNRSTTATRRLAAFGRTGVCTSRRSKSITPATPGSTIGGHTSFSRKTGN